MKRHEDWEKRLAAFIESRRCMPFAWGVQDCCQFSRRGIEAQTLEDPANDWALTDYSTARAAALLLRSLGGVEVLPARAGLVEVPVAMAQRGFTMLVPTRRRLALGLCLGEMTAAPGARGLEFVSTLECAKAWRF